MNTGTVIFTAYWWTPVGSAKICRNSLLAMNLSIHGAVILAWDFSVRWGKANSSPGIHDGNMIPAQTRRKKRLGFISPDHAAPGSPDLLPRPRGGTTRWDRGDRKKRVPKTAGKRGENGEVWWDKKRETKREIKRRIKRERRIIDGRRRLPEDYTSRRLQFTPFGKLDIHRPTPPPRCILPPFVERRRMKYALAWISNSAANRIKLAMNLPTKSKRRKGKRERNRWSFEKEAMGLFAHSRDKDDLKGWRPAGTNQLRWMNNVSG